MIKPSRRRSWRRKKFFALGIGFGGSRSIKYRILRQQLLHSGYTAYIGLRLKKRCKRKAHKKLLNFFLRTRGKSYAHFKSKQKQKASILTTRVVIDFLILKQDMLDMLFVIIRY